MQLPELLPGQRTPTIEGINTAIVMGASPKQVQGLLLRGDPPPNIHEKDKFSISPIHMACLIPEGVYSHSPLSVFEVVVAAGASTTEIAGLKNSVCEGLIVPAHPYCLAAYARNTAIIRYMNGPMSSSLIKPRTFLHHAKTNYNAETSYTRLCSQVGSLAALAFVVACSNLNTGGPFIATLPRDAYPRLYEIYLERTSIGASTARRQETIKAILELEKKKSDMHRCSNTKPG